MAHTKARLCGQATGHSNHPRLEVKMTFATPGGRKELKIKDHIADSGTQITILLASLLEASSIQISGMRKSKADLRATNNAKIDVQGVTDAAISALLHLASNSRRLAGSTSSETSTRCICRWMS